MMKKFLNACIPHYSNLIPSIVCWFLIHFFIHMFMCTGIYHIEEGNIIPYTHAEIWASGCYANLLPKEIIWLPFLVYIIISYFRYRKQKI